jgi:hypothetical protein
MLINKLFDGSIVDDSFDKLKLALGLGLHKDNQHDPTKPGVRPIAIKECITNLASRLLLNQCADKIKQSLSPFDLGYGFKGACPAVIHGLNAV